MNISIVIPHHNHWQMTHGLLFDLYMQERANIFEVMLVDDASDEDGVAGGELWWKDNGMLPVRVFRFEENRGFLLSANKGLKRAKGDILVLLSNDVQVKRPFLQQVRDLLEKDPRQFIGNVYFQRSTGWNEFDGKVFPYLSGYILAATAEAWEELDYFDTRYEPQDFEDVDLSTTALSKGYRLVSLANPGLLHLGGGTLGFSPEREKLTRENQEKFRKKWVTHEQD